MKDLLGMGMDDPFFPVDLDDLPVQLKIEEMADGSEARIGPYRVRAASIWHPAPALAYRIEADGRSLVYATDTEDAFSGKPNPVVALAKGANTLIHDAQFLPADFKATWGHSTFDAAIDVALKAQVGRLVLYHHDPDRSDDALDRIGREAQQAASAKRKDLEVLVAREGLELEI
jgi:ribonuclease BN (tRNA processing enzyme)